MTQFQRAATGPAILEHIVQIEARLAAIEERLASIETQARHRHAVADQRYERTDQYIVGEAFNVDATLKQVREVLDAWRETLHTELSQMRAALGIHLSDPGRDGDDG